VHWGALARLSYAAVCAVLCGWRTPPLQMAFMAAMLGTRVVADAAQAALAALAVEDAGGLDQLRAVSQQEVARAQGVEAAEGGVPGVEQAAAGRQGADTDPSPGSDKGLPPALEADLDWSSLRNRAALCSRVCSRGGEGQAPGGGGGAPREEPADEGRRVAGEGAACVCRGRHATRSLSRPCACQCFRCISGKQGGCHVGEQSLKQLSLFCSWCPFAVEESGPQACSLL